MKLNAKELHALERILKVYGDKDVPMLDVQQVTDPAGVGWLRVRVDRPIQGSSQRRAERDLRVSPLGHVYDWNSMDLLLEGPPV